ncbi:MAG: hypothetical protein ACYCPQ_06040 [Elusimicrobiota bacterium]
MKKIWRAAGVIIGCSAAVYAMAYVDLALRARSAYQEGEKYLLWAREPALKKSHYDARLAEEESRLHRDYSAGRLNAEDLSQKIELAQIRHDRAIAESSLKYAYVWFRSGAELFSPPQSRWAVLCRQEMPAAKALWKKELDARHIHYQDYMLE